MSEEKQQSLEPITNPVTFMEILREVINNPDVPVEKVQALYAMQREMEADIAEREYDAAMIVAQKEIKALKWDKKGDNNLYASYPKIEAMLQPVREKHGFSQNFDTEPGPTADQMFICMDVAHTGGHRRRYRLPMAIDGQGPKGGGVMTRPQAVGNGTSYGMRYLAKMVWNIPMLVDKDDNDGAAIVDRINEKQLADLKALADETKRPNETLAKVIKNLCYVYNLQKIEEMPVSVYQGAINTLNAKRNIHQ
jgi:hypothetical protein